MKMRTIIGIVLIGMSMSACVTGEEEDRDAWDVNGAGVDKMDMGLDADNKLDAKMPGAPSSEPDKGTPLPDRGAPRDAEQPVLCDGTMSPYSLISVYEADGQTPYCGELDVKITTTDFRGETYEYEYTEEDCMQSRGIGGDMWDSSIMCSCYVPFGLYDYEITVPGQGTVKGTGQTPDECSGVLHIKKSLPFD